MGTRVCSILRAQDLQQSLTSFWYYHNPSAKPYTVSITVGPQPLQGFSTLEYSFTITRRTIHRFATSIHGSGSATSIHEFGSTTSIGMQHFQQFCRVSMLLTKVPQPLQQPMLLYKPLTSFVALYIQHTFNRSCQHQKMFWMLYYILFERFFHYLKWVFHGISFCLLVCQI